MSPSVVLWILGGWLAVAAACSLLIGRMTDRGRFTDVQEAAEAAAPIDTPASRASRQSIAA